MHTDNHWHLNAKKVTDADSSKNIFLVCVTILAGQTNKPGCVAQSVGHLTRKSGVLGSIPSLATYFRFSFCRFKKDSVTGESMRTKYWLTRLGGLSLPRKSVVRLAVHPDMTLDVYRGRKTTI